MKDEETSRIVVGRLSDYWYVDCANATEKDAQAFHIMVRTKVVELLKLPESEMVSTKRLSAVKTRTSMRFLHIFTIPADLDLEALRKLELIDSITAFHSDLCTRPLLLLRATNTVAALEVLVHVPHLAACFATPNILAVASSGTREEAIEVVKRPTWEVSFQSKTLHPARYFGHL